MHEDEEQRLAVVDDVTCLGCGCLCDDITVRVEQGRISDAERACVTGKQWFGVGAATESGPTASIEGVEVTLGEALERAAELLVRARAPVLTGLAGCSLEAQAVAVGIADRVGGVIDPLCGDAEWRLAVERLGHVSATLGEVKNRADLVIYWGADPLESHPRHLECYAVEPAGRFVPGGRRQRFVVVVDSEENETSRRADLFLRVPGDRQLGVIGVLRARLREARLDRDRVKAGTGLTTAEVAGLLSRIRQSRYGALFVGERVSEGLAGRACVEALLMLARDVNLIGGRRFVALPLGKPGNVAGAEAVLGWQTGAPSAVDFGRGFPRYLPGEAVARERVARGQADLVLALIDPGGRERCQNEFEARESLPIVVIGAGTTSAEQTFWPAVAIETSRLGIDDGGTVVRCDGVALPLRPALRVAAAGMLEVLKELAARVERRLETRGDA
jgi:formylmethanofuran dehydrogenase subunit B